MAFFCDRTGVRIVAPGTSKSAGGTVPEHDGTDMAVKAEQAAIDALHAGRKSAEEIVPSADATKAAVAAAVSVVAPADVKVEPTKPIIPQKPDIRGGRGQ